MKRAEASSRHLDQKKETLGCRTLRFLRVRVFGACGVPFIGGGKTEASRFYMDCLASLRFFLARAGFLPILIESVNLKARAVIAVARWFSSRRSITKRLGDGSRRRGKNSFAINRKNGAPKRNKKEPHPLNKNRRVRHPRALSAAPPALYEADALSSRRSRAGLTAFCRPMPGLTILFRLRLWRSTIFWTRFGRSLSLLPR